MFVYMPVSLISMHMQLRFFSDLSLSLVEKFKKLEDNYDNSKSSVIISESEQDFKYSSMITTRWAGGMVIYACKLCEKILPNKHVAEQHSRVHTGEKPYKCPLCKKGFKQKGNLKVHVRVHSDERPFSCPTCSAHFRQKSHMMVHVIRMNHWQRSVNNETE